jgi:hypothetical protein
MPLVLRSVAATIFPTQVRRISTMKSVFCGLASVSLFLCMTGEAKADYARDRRKGSTRDT